MHDVVWDFVLKFGFACLCDCFRDYFSGCCLEVDLRGFCFNSSFSLCVYLLLTRVKLVVGYCLCFEFVFGFNTL